MQIVDLATWMDNYSSKGWYWYVKRLSGNDTLLNRTHQAGPYIPGQVADELAPSVRRSTLLNPRKWFRVSIDSHLLEENVSAIWYNNRIIRDGTRDECRITNWGGSSSPVLDPDSTGSIFILAFHKTGNQDADEVRVWLCTDLEQEDLVENRIGPVEPGARIFIVHSSTGVLPQISYGRSQKPTSCHLSTAEIPPAWLDTFPSAIEIAQKAISLRPARGRSADDRLMQRKSCEYDVFRSVEEQHVLPQIRQGFSSVEEFLELASSIANRRKSRAGKSLEFQTKAVFDEEHVRYSHGEVSELNKKPDFLFPSARVYHNSAKGAKNLYMLAVKTTCKDRWRQILNEADKIPVKHLLTVQEGISENQFREMRAADVILVVPRSLHSQYIPAIRPQLLTLEDFIAVLRGSQ